MRRWGAYGRLALGGMVGAALTWGLVSGRGAWAGEPAPPNSPEPGLEVPTGDEVAAERAVPVLRPRADLPPPRSLEYLEWTSRPHETTDVVPTVILLHGMGGTPERALPTVQFGDLDIRVIAPRAPLNSGKGSAWVTSRRADTAPGGQVDQAFRALSDLTALIDRLAVERPMAGKPVVVGFSQGGMMAYGLAIYHPDLIRAVDVLSGPLPNALVPLRATDAQVAVPISVLHGDADPVVDPALTRAAVDKLEAAGFTVRFEMFPGVRHRVSEAERRRVRQDLLDAFGALCTP